MKFKFAMADGATFVTGLAIIELIFGSWLNEDKSNYLNVIKNTKIEIKTDSLYQSAKKTILYSRDSNGLRGSFKKTKDVNILSIGGSTTDQRLIDDSETWQMSLQRALNDRGFVASIANAGVDGQSTLGLIRDFPLWLDHVQDLKPKYCLIYVGTNDFYKDALYLSARDTILSFQEILKINSFHYHLINKVKNTLSKSEVKLSHSKVDFTKLTWTDHGILDSMKRHALLRERVNSFKTRLDVLAKVCLARGIQPIFITPPSRMFKLEVGKVIGSTEEFLLEGVRYNGVDFYYFFTRFNQATKDFCNQNKYYCIDLLNELNLSNEDFYDYSHNTPIGAEKIGYYIGAKLMEMDILKSVNVELNHQPILR